MGARRRAIHDATLSARISLGWGRAERRDTAAREAEGRAGEWPAWMQWWTLVQVTRWRVRAVRRQRVHDVRWLLVDVVDVLTAGDVAEAVRREDGQLVGGHWWAEAVPSEEDLRARLLRARRRLSAFSANDRKRAPLHTRAPAHTRTQAGLRSVGPLSTVDTANEEATLDDIVAAMTARKAAAKERRGRAWSDVEVRKRGLLARGGRREALQETVHVMGTGHAAGRTYTREGSKAEATKEGARSSDFETVRAGHATGRARSGTSRRGSGEGETKICRGGATLAEAAAMGNGGEPRDGNRWGQRRVQCEQMEGGDGGGKKRGEHGGRPRLHHKRGKDPCASTTGWTDAHLRGRHGRAKPVDSG